MVSEFTSANVRSGQAGSSLVERRQKRRFYMVSEFTSVNVGAVKLAQLGFPPLAERHGD